MSADYKPFGPIFSILKTVVDEANAIRERYIAGTKKSEDAVKVYLNDHAEDPTVVQYNAALAKIDERVRELTTKRQEIVKSFAAEVSGTDSFTDEQKKAVREEFLAKRKVANLTRENLLLLLGNDEAALKAGLSEFGIVEIPNLGGGVAATKGTTGIVRKRIASATVDGESVADSKGKVSFTTLSQRLKVDGAVIREAAAKSAGVDSVKDIPAGASVSFQVVSGEGEKAKTHNVTIVTPEADEDSAEDTDENVTESNDSEVTESEVTPAE